jgi:hypothetical protein
LERAPHSADGYLEPVRRNAFRLLGLRGAATQREIHEAASAVRRRLKLGVAHTSPQDALWLGPLERTEMDVRDALGRLARPAQRIAERLLWFYEDAPHVAPTANLVTRGGAEALVVRTEERHDAALASFAAALRFDPDVKQGEIWTRALSLWQELTERDEFWSLLVAADLKGDFEQLATHGEARELRARVMHLVTTPLAGLAKDGVARKRYDVTTRALEVLRCAGLEEKLFAGYENEILAPVEDGFEALNRSVFDELRWERMRYNSPDAQRQACDATLRRFDREIKPALAAFLKMAGVESLATRRVFESAAVELFQLADAYQRGGEREAGQLLARKAWTFAPPESVAAFEIEEGRAQFGGADWGGARTQEEYLARLRRELRPQTELFAQYITQENLSPQLSSAPNFTPTPARDMSEGFGQIFLYVLFVIACIGFGVCSSSGTRRGYRGNIHLPPPTFNYNYNVQLPPLVTPRINIEELKLNLNPGRAPSRRARRRQRARRAETPVQPPTKIREATP